MEGEITMVTFIQKLSRATAFFGKLPWLTIGWVSICVFMFFLGIKPGLGMLVFVILNYGFYRVVQTYDFRELRLPVESILHNIAFLLSLVSALAAFIFAAAVTSIFGPVIEGVLAGTFAAGFFILYQLFLILRRDARYYALGLDKKSEEKQSDE